MRYESVISLHFLTWLFDKIEHTKVGKVITYACSLSLVTFWIWGFYKEPGELVVVAKMLLLGVALTAIIILGFILYGYFIRKR